MDVNDGQYSLDDAMQLDDDSLESAEVDEQDSEQQPQEDNLESLDEAHQDSEQQDEQDARQHEVQQQELPDLEAMMTASTSLLRQLQWSSLVDAFQVPSGSSLASLFVSQFDASQFDAESDTSDEDVEQQQQPLRHLHCRRCGCTRIPDYLMPAHRYVHRYLQTDGAVIRRVWEIASRAPNVVRTGVLDEYTLNSAISESLGAVEVGVEDVDAVSERCLTDVGQTALQRTGSPLNCPICLEPVRCDARRLVQCEHTFCDACITPWLMQSKKCPLCMSELRL